MLVDISTSRKFFLMGWGCLLATGTAAAPAFDGGQLSRGTRAVAGATAHVGFVDACFPLVLKTSSANSRTLSSANFRCHDVRRRWS